jgi:hypothetical protein
MHGSRTFAKMLLSENDANKDKTPKYHILSCSLFYTVVQQVMFRYPSSYVQNDMQDVTSLITYRCCHDVLQPLNVIHLKMTFKLRLSHED